MSSKLTKKQLINDIKVFYLKQGKECDNTIMKISKTKLLEIVLENDIPHINNETLKKEIEETEKFNFYMNIIYYNFIKFNKPSYDIIRNIKNNSNINSYNLDIIIKENDLIISNDIEDIKILVLDLFNSIHKYCSNTNTKNTIQYKTIPSIIQFLNNLNSSQ
jgi:hypothetical protein